MKHVRFTQGDSSPRTVPERFDVRIKWGLASQEAGFTLPEAATSLVILSIFIIVAMTLFSNTYANINQADLDLDLLHEAHMFLGQLGNDIRSALTVTVHSGSPQSSVEILSLKLVNSDDKDQGKESSIIYLYDPPGEKNLEGFGRIRRIPSFSQRGIDLLSQNVKSLKFSLNPPQNVVHVDLELEKRLYGVTRNFRTHSAYHIGGK
jgi:hypothetical protein